MKKYVILASSNLIVVALYSLIAYYFKSISQQAGLGAVGIGLQVLAVFGLYLMLYGVFSYKYTKSVVFPNLLLLAFLIVLVVIISIIKGITINTSSLVSNIIDSLFSIMFVLLFSLIPSIITKVIMVLTEKHKKTKSSDEKAV